MLAAVYKGKEELPVEEVAEGIGQLAVVAGDEVIDAERRAGAFRGDGRQPTPPLRCRTRWPHPPPRRIAPPP